MVSEAPEDHRKLLQVRALGVGAVDAPPTFFVPLFARAHLEGQANNKCMNEQGAPSFCACRRLFDRKVRPRAYGLS